ncbi:MAG: hypothetical protein ACOYOS_07995 [Syntrophales bacterium]
MDKTIFQEMLDAWPSPLVARTECSTFSGGLVKEKTLANYDSAGIGPKGRFRIGRKICYPTKNLVAWLQERSSCVIERTRQIEVAR